MKESILHVCLQGLFIPVYSQTRLINDAFDSPGAWKAVSVQSTGSFSIANGVLAVNANSGATYGVYNPQVLSGHFDVQVDFGADNHVALALFNVNNGNLDLNNYTMICIDSVSGKATVSAHDRQDDRYFIFNCTDPVNPSCQFAITHNSPSYITVNPAFRINNWGRWTVLAAINGQPLNDSSFTFANIGNDVLVWLNITFSAATTSIAFSKGMVVGVIKNAPSGFAKTRIMKMKNPRRFNLQGRVLRKTGLPDRLGAKFRNQIEIEEH